MLMDMEQRRVVALLPERSTDSFFHWLRRHPEVGMISRGLKAPCCSERRARSDRRNEASFYRCNPVDPPAEVPIQKADQEHYSSGRMADLLAKPHRKFSTEQAELRVCYGTR